MTIDDTIILSACHIISETHVLIEVGELRASLIQPTSMDMNMAKDIL